MQLGLVLSGKNGTSCGQNGQDILAGKRRGTVKMAAKKTQAEIDQEIKEIAEARRQREQGYRERALRMYPRICARCGREFSGKKLRELTVHHKDHNHDNNPADGSNWELLCLYCHDNEHSRDAVADAFGELTPGRKPESLPSHSPFAALESLLKKKK
jgi:5-methylcytosine-specific restriction endonuclease McrA